MASFYILSQDYSLSDENCLCASNLGYAADVICSFVNFVTAADSKVAIFQPRCALNLKPTCVSRALNVPFSVTPVLVLLGGSCRAYTLAFVSIV